MGNGKNTPTLSHFRINVESEQLISTIEEGDVEEVDIRRVQRVSEITT